MKASAEKSHHFRRTASESVTAIGDSIAAGYGLDSQEDYYLTLFSDNIGAVLIMMPSAVMTAARC